MVKEEDTEGELTLLSEEPVTEGKKKRKKKILAASGAAAILLAAGTAAFIWQDSVFPASEGSREGTEQANYADAVFIDVPPMIVNLRSASGSPRFLKLHFVLVSDSSDDVPEIEKRLPLLLDAYQPFLRELRPEDLAGSAAVFRVKEEMLVRSTAIFGEGKVRDVLIQDLIQQ